MNNLARLLGGFFALFFGGLLSLLLMPEFGIPLMLIGTRLLGHRYAWARKLNVKIDAGWIRFKSWFKKVFGKKTK